MSKFIIAAGHGGTDPGAVSGGSIERDIAESQLDKAFDLCSRQDTKGRQLVKVPHTLAFYDSINWINSQVTNADTDLCMEVHLNSNAGAAGTGTETYYGNVALATEIHQEAVKVLGLSDRGVKDGNAFAFNNSTTCASCLIELGFVNNNIDVAAIIDRGALALAKGIIRACGGVYVEPAVTPPVIIPPVVTPDYENQIAQLNTGITALQSEKTVLENNLVKEQNKSVALVANLQDVTVRLDNTTTQYNASVKILNTANETVTELQGKLSACESKPTQECPKQPQTVGEWFNGLISAIFRKRS